MATVTREFAPADRYMYDFRICVPSKGWAQMDTGQDASYFGNWINPITLELFSYCEGDTTHTQCTDTEDFAVTVRKTCDWYRERDDFRGIDAMMRPEIAHAFCRAGLAPYLHNDSWES